MYFITISEISQEEFRILNTLIVIDESKAIFTDNGNIKFC